MKYSLLVGVNVEVQQHLRWFDMNNSTSMHYFPLVFMRYIAKLIRCLVAYERQTVAFLRYEYLADPIEENKNAPRICNRFMPPSRKEKVKVLKVSTVLVHHENALADAPCSSRD